ncbi:tetratricopeptide repeat protein [Marinobacter salinexigens]|uniref:tetratricopeptide repeat protein n=1 Tax=Marinobacter salinexigens TaxID=2919747 RepID=UPI00165F4E60|nr:tetratricopeptide repeat protein [Marinobacter salinexigens]
MWFAVAGAAQATTDKKAAESLNTGVILFQSGDLVAARDSFLEAEALGLHSPSLTYNLAVVYYRLGDYGAAEERFRSLLESGDRTLAEYNLGLVALANGDQEAARSWFLSVSETGGRGKLQQMADTQLGRLSGREDAGGYQGVLSLAGGYDSNIAGLPDAGASSKGGAFTEGFAAGSYDLYTWQGSSFGLDGVLYTRRYPSDSDYDSSLIQGGMFWRQNLENAEQGVGIVLSQSWFGGDTFETRYGLEAERQWLACGGGFDLECSVDVAAALIQGGSRYRAYDGDWYRIRLSVAKRAGPWRLSGQYRWTLENREDLTYSDQFVSLSPQHHRLELAARYVLKQDLMLGVESAFRFSRYQDPHVYDQDGTLVSERRVDRRINASLFAEQWLTDRWMIRGEWQYQDTDSSIEVYGYRRHTVMLGIEGVFGPG